MDTAVISLRPRHMNVVSASLVGGSQNDWRSGFARLPILSIENSTERQVSVRPTKLLRDPLSLTHGWRLRLMIRVIVSESASAGEN